MGKFQLQNYKKKAAQGVMFLSVKRIFIQIVLTGSNILLARLLFPVDFGTFAIVNFVITFFTVFSDIGLGPSLVQKKGVISKKDLQTAFTLQLILSIAVVVVIYFFSPVISNFYHIGEKGTALFRIYSLYLLFMPFKTTSGAILERSLAYKNLIIIEVIEVIVGSFLTVILALWGFGVFSFAYGSVVGHLVGGILYYSFAKWPIDLVIFRENLSKLARFGLPFQSSAVFSLFYGSLILLYLGKVAGAENLGYFQWAAGFAVFPTIVSDIMNRILFALGARAQSDRQFFRKIIERSVAIVSSTSLPLASIIMATAPSIIHFVYTDKWLPALPAVYIGLIQMVIIAHTGIFSQLLLARGRADVTRNMGFVWAILTWVVSPPLIYFFNFVGMSLAALLVSVSGIYLFFRLKQEVDFSFAQNFIPYLVSSALSGILVFLTMRVLPTTFPLLIITLSLGLLFYAVVIWFFRGREVFTNYKYLILALKRVSD